MTAKIDTKHTMIEDKTAIKEAIADFRASLTEQGLARMYSEAFDVDTWGEVLRCDVSAFVASSYMMDCGLDCSFMIDMIIKTPTKFITLHFFIDEMDGQYHVCEVYNLHEMQVYELITAR